MKDRTPVICPICKNPVPFGLEMHMIAAHGEKSAAYERETERIREQLTAKPNKRPGKHRTKHNKSKGNGKMKGPRFPKPW